MFEKFTSAGSGDFSQRYLNTFGYFTDEKGKRLVKLTHIDESQCLFVDVKGIEYKLHPDSERDVGFLFIPPESRYYNTEDGVVLVQRVPARQFQRGISPRNTQLTTFIPKVGLHAERWSFSLLEKVYEKEVPFNKLKINFMELPAGGLAISRQFAVMNDQRIYLYENSVGTFTADSPTNLTIKLNEPDLWRTEISDALKTLNCTAKIG